MDLDQYVALPGLFFVDLISNLSLGLLVCSPAQGRKLTELLSTKQGSITHAFVYGLIYSTGRVALDRSFKPAAHADPLRFAYTWMNAVVDCLADATANQGPCPTLSAHRRPT